MTTAHTFKTGNYYTTGAADYVWTFKIIARTAKFVTIEDEWGDTKRVGVTVSGDREIALPCGNYSMAPVIVADRPVD